MTLIVSLLGTPRQWARDLAAAAAIGLFLGIIGPFGSFYGGPVELRVPYWIGNVIIGFTIMPIIIRGSLLAASPLDLPVWFALAVGVVVGSAPLCLALAAFSRVFWTHASHSDPLLQMYGQTLAIAEPCAFAYHYLMTVRPTPPPPETAANPMGQPPSPAAAAVASPILSSRLPSSLGRDLLCLQMEDHYVRVHTLKGSDLILTSLKEAMSELQSADGLQVHRSWWVRRSAVEEIVTKGRNLVLRLQNGLEVPVSRAAVARLRASGWLDSAESASPDKPNGGA